jgi:F-type H+-transporting ATPase subunit b
MVGGDMGAFYIANPLVTPIPGLMLWTLLAFAITLIVLQRLAFPKIAEALDKRRLAIEESIDSAERTKLEADKLLEEYRARLGEAREQAEDIVRRARKASESLQEDSKVEAKRYREELMASTRRDIESETQRALGQIHREVANLTVVATEKVTRKALDDEDHRRLIDEALQEVDFSALAGEGNGHRGDGGSAADGAGAGAETEAGR